MAGIDAGDISADFDVSGGPDVGVHLTADMSFGALIRFIARAETAAVAPDHTGSWRYSPLSGPKEIPDYDLPFDHIHDLTPVGQSAVPVSRVRIGYGRNHQALSRSDMAQAILGTSAETTMGSEWRYASAENTVTQSRWAGVEERTILTPIREAADASALASSLLETLGPRAGGGAREQLRLVLPFDTDRAVLPLGSTVRVDYPPAGIDRTFVLTGAELTRPKREQMIWRVWG